MKAILRGNEIDREQGADMTRLRGTSKRPQPPRDVICQTAPQGLLVTWHYPVVNGDIQRWRVYKNNEITLHAEITDRGTRQCFVPATDSVPINVFVSSLNAAGVESTKVYRQGTPGASTATMPDVPPEYNDIDSGGRDIRTDFQ